MLLVSFSRTFSAFIANNSADADTKAASFATTFREECTSLVLGESYRCWRDGGFVAAIKRDPKALAVSRSQSLLRLFPVRPHRYFRSSP